MRNSMPRPGHPFCFALLALIVLPSFSVAQTYEWSKRFGGGTTFPCGADGRAVTIDSHGNIIVTGSFLGTVNFGGAPLVSAGRNDIAVAKFDKDGNHLWSRRFGTSVEDFGIDVTADPSGNIIVVAETNSDFDVPESDILLLKLDSAGTLLWSHTFAGGVGAIDVPYGVAVDASGAISITGQFTGSIDFGGGPLASAGGSDIFLAKFDATGNHVWSKRFGGTNYDVGWALATDSGSNIMLTGYFRESVDFGDGLHTSAGQTDIVLAKFDAGGALLWSHAYGGGAFDSGYSVAIDPSSQIYICGYTNFGVDLGGGAPFSHTYGNDDLFVAAYDAGGAHLWSRQFDSDGYQQGLGIACMTSGGVVVTGMLDLPMVIDGIPLTTNSAQDIMTARFDATGQAEWAHAYGGPFSDLARGIASGPGGEIVIIGAFQGTVNFGGPDMTSQCSANMYLAKYSDPVPVPTLIQSFDAAGTDRGIQLRWRIYDDAAQVAGYNIERRAGGDATRLTSAPLAPTNTSYMDDAARPSVEYQYQLIVLLRDGTTLLSPMAESTRPAFAFGNAHSYPNPFNPNTTIAYELDQRSHVVVSVFGPDGKRVRTLYDAIASAGNNEVEWDGRDDAGNVAASGLYVYRIQSGKRIVTGKMMLVK